jgi:hypothetical protein
MEKKMAQRQVTGGKPQRRPVMENLYDDGLSKRSLEVSATLLNGGLDSSQQVKVSNFHKYIFTSNEPSPMPRTMAPSARAETART